MMKILDLGCGKRKMRGAIGIDMRRDADADVIHDLNVFPYPFADNEFDYVYADNIIEHLDDVIRVMEELHRVTKHSAIIKIIVPLFRSAYAFIDPTHRHFFTARSFDYFDPRKEINHLYKYSQCYFGVKRVAYDEGLKNRFYVKPLVWFANRHPIFYELNMSALFPLNSVTYYLETLKEK